MKALSRKVTAVAAIAAAMLSVSPARAEEPDGEGPRAAVRRLLSAGRGADALLVARAELGLGGSSPEAARGIPPDPLAYVSVGDNLPIYAGQQISVGVGGATVGAVTAKFKVILTLPPEVRFVAVNRGDGLTLVSRPRTGQSGRVVLETGPQGGDGGLYWLTCAVDPRAKSGSLALRAEIETTEPGNDPSNDVETADFLVRAIGSCSGLTPSVRLAGDGRVKIKGVFAGVVLVNGVRMAGQIKVGTYSITYRGPAESGERLSDWLSPGERVDVVVDGAGACWMTAVVR